MLNIAQQSSPVTVGPPQPQITIPVPPNPPTTLTPAAPQIQVQATTMSAQPVTAQATITTPVDDKTNLRGKQPPVFDGMRSKADNFWRAFKIYCILNKETNTIKSPFHRTTLAISFITRPNVDDWAEHQLDQLEEKTSLTNPNRYVDTNGRLWTEFETAFQAAYQDTTRAQDAYPALMQLEMKGWDIDTYIATFD